MTHPAPHDEQTETDELHKLIEDFDKFPEQGSMSQYVFEERVRAWSRQQTAQVLDELRMELHLYTAAHDRYMRDEALKLIAELRVGLEGQHGDSK